MTLVALPFIGEIGWLTFSWSQIVYKKFIDNVYNRCIVYCNGGAEAFFPYAEVRKFSVPFKYDSECNTVHNLNGCKNKLIEFENLIQKKVEKEIGRADFIKPTQLKFGSPCYNDCQPYVLKNEYKLDGLHGFLITLCIRDRELGSDRNWTIEKWLELSDRLKNVFKGSLCIVGKVRKEWEEAFQNKGVINLLNKTDLSELAGVLSQSDLVIGGSTGSMHMASLAAKDHLVWCTERTAKRYYETNHHKVQCKCIVDKEAWNPDINRIINEVVYYLQKGEFSK